MMTVTSWSTINCTQTRNSSHMCMYMRRYEHVRCIWKQMFQS